MKLIAKAMNFKERNIRLISRKKGVPESYVKKQLEIGQREEMEHTDNSDTAYNIAMDHLKETPYYYDKLADAGLMEKAKYIKRTGSPGNYNYIYKQPENKTPPNPDKEKVNIQRDFTRISNQIKKISGVEDIKAKYSGLSGSSYIEFSHNNNDYKIRVSDHDLPESYKGKHGETHFDVTPGGPLRGDSNGHWDDAVLFAYKVTENEAPESIKSSVQNKNKEREKVRKEREDASETLKQRIETGKESKEDVVKRAESGTDEEKRIASEIRDLQEEFNESSGKKKKKIRAKINKRIVSLGGSLIKSKFFMKSKAGEQKRLANPPAEYDHKYKLQGYKKCHGLNIAIENKKGSYRRGIDQDGKPWETFMNFDYGRITGTKGIDLEAVDIYIGPDDLSEMVYVVHQLDPTTGLYDEDKALIYYPSRESAIEGYLSQYDRPGFLGEVSEFTIEEFKESLKEKNGEMLYQSPLMVKSEGKMRKAKYIRRTGTSGSYKYIYKEGEDKEEKDLDPPIPSKEFDAAAYYDKTNDPNATTESVLKDAPEEVKVKIAATEKRLKDVVPSIDKYRESGEGAAAVYTPERQALHEKIIGEFLTEEKMKAATPNNGAEFIMLGGRGASGKSWFKGNVYDPNTSIVLDADEIKQKLPEYEGWNAFEVHEESSDILETMIAIAKSRKLNIVIDATMKTTSSAVERVKDFKESGYDIKCHYMHCPRQISAQRAVKRFGGKSGRYVPVGVVLSNTSNEKTFESVKEFASSWSFLDSSGGPPPEMVSKSNGAAMKKAIDESKAEKANPDPYDEYDFGKVTKEKDYSEHTKNMIEKFSKPMKKSVKFVMKRS